MSPAYEQAIDAVRWGPGFWAIVIFPALVIWLGAAIAAVVFRKPHPPHALAVAILTYPLALALFWVLYTTHAQRLQDAKHHHARTDAERMDWSSDTWRVYAPIFAVPIGGIYCGLHQSLTTPLAVGITLLRRRHHHRCNAKWTGSRCAKAHNDAAASQ